MRASPLLRALVWVLLANAACGGDGDKREPETDADEGEPAGQNGVDAASAQGRDGGELDGSRDAQGDASDDLDGALNADAGLDPATRADASDVFDAAASEDASVAAVAEAGLDAASDAASDAAALDAGPGCPELESPLNCGQCGNVCPGFMAPNDVVSCQQHSCTFACRGESYDVDGNAANGCEFVDTPQGNHTMATALNQGAPSTCSGSPFFVAGALPSDARTHEAPPVPNFDLATGSAPDYVAFQPVSSPFCTNDLVATLTVPGAADPACFALRAFTDKLTSQCQTNATGSCSINLTGGVAQFSNNTRVVFAVAKTCPTNTPADVHYRLTGNF